MCGLSIIPIAAARRLCLFFCARACVCVCARAGARVCVSWLLHGYFCACITTLLRSLHTPSPHPLRCVGLCGMPPADHFPMPCYTLLFGSIFASSLMPASPRLDSWRGHIYSALSWVQVSLLLGSHVYPQRMLCIKLLSVSSPPPRATQSGRPRLLFSCFSAAGR